MNDMKKVQTSYNCVVSVWAFGRLFPFSTTYFDSFLVLVVLELANKNEADRARHIVLTLHSVCYLLKWLYQGPQKVQFLSIRCTNHCNN